MLKQSIEALHARDFETGTRNIWAVQADAHSASMSPAPLDDLDALIASFQTAGQSSRVSTRTTLT